ncbi:hypothetical protein FOTG_18755 [Fusarium oxysporum f. sp. vasinfectum 25433]|uniref:Uncharacterized protein n=1 Tax=Fusarium oxysporum f. sp. vasinfectum 25433 TaxID=1089449 RepID=X0LWA0_FUSOX|nr:hypothetical protein FOTG_18755 [Fusarium oxysporum f. sp. vasinfectum 25433]
MFSGSGKLLTLSAQDDANLILDSPPCSCLGLRSTTRRQRRSGTLLVRSITAPGRLRKDCQ